MVKSIILTLLLLFQIRPVLGEDVILRSQCIEAINEADAIIALQDTQLKLCKEEVNRMWEENSEKTVEAEHSHVPHIVGTSSFWLLLLLLL